MFEIRPFHPRDWDAVWSFVKPVFRAGETYGIPRDITKDEAFLYWVKNPKETYVCVDDKGQVLGTYYLKPNQLGPGQHVCNCGYIVNETARGRGVARQMGEHSFKMAKKMGFYAMQYNLVAASNIAAIKLWESLGMEIVATLPGAFDHAKLGRIDAHVMYRIL